MLLFAIFPVDEISRHIPLAMKIDKNISVVPAFRTEASANAFIQEKCKDGKFDVLELTLDDFDEVSMFARSSLKSDLYIKIHE